MLASVDHVTANRRPECACHSKEGTLILAFNQCAVAPRDGLIAACHAGSMLEVVEWLRTDDAARCA